MNNSLILANYCHAMETVMRNLYLTQVESLTFFVLTTMIATGLNVLQS